jgi:hypothetical protein
MNTKILVALVIGIALFGLTGAASACETSTSSIYYNFVRNVDGQGINDVVTDLDLITSTAGWDDQRYPGDNCGNERVIIQNTLVDTWATPAVDGDGIYHATVIQTGGASITKRPLDSEAPCDLPELESKVFKSQDVIVSGQFKSFGADFADFASVGVNWYDPIRPTVSGCGNCHATEVSNAWGSVVANGHGTRISEAAVGTDTWTSLKADGWTGTVVMDGGSSAYSEFYGDTIVPLGPGTSITTTSGSTATHDWNAHCGVAP